MDPNNKFDLDVKQYSFKLFGVGTQKLISENNLRASPNLEVLTERTIEGLLIQLNDKLLSTDWYEHVGVHEVPLTWWDHFKLEVVPQWLKLKFPKFFKVHYKILFEDRLYVKVCPHSDLKFKDHSVVHMEWLSTNPLTLKN
jgi:hypothetical protein